MSPDLRVRNGRIVVTLTVHDLRPRDWTAHETSLVEEVAERTWEAVERAKAELAQRESEERFQQFAKASAAGLWIRDAEMLAMEFVSPAIEAIYGISADELHGDIQRWAAMIVPEDRKSALQPIERARHGDTAQHEFRISGPMMARSSGSGTPTLLCAITATFRASAASPKT